MRKVALLAICAVAIFAIDASAQRNPIVDVFDSPIKVESEVYNAGEVISCSAAFPGTAALFGGDTVTEGASQSFIVNELFGTFRTFSMDGACNITGTWSTAFVGTTQTGCAVPNGSSATYWAVDTAGAVINEHTTGIGTATGTSVPVSGGLLYGSLVINDHTGGQDGCYNEIVNDTYTCIDMTATGAFICLYANADNTGGGAFGNSIGDAFDPSACSTTTLVQATGTINEGQVNRVGQYGCGGTDPSCSDQWDVGTFSTFVNDIDEYDCNGEPGLLTVDNAGGAVLLLKQPVGIADCQDIDSDMDLLWVNASQGGVFFQVPVNTAAPISTGMQKTALGNGKYVYHMNAGTPNSGTVSGLFDLGNQCFPFIGGSAVVIENNVGKTNLVGSTSYFGAPGSNPAKAPTFVRPTDAVVDTFNMPSGSQFTGQAIHLNGGASSAKGGSLSNALVYDMQ